MHPSKLAARCPLYPSSSTRMIYVWWCTDGRKHPVYARACLFVLTQQPRKPSWTALRRHRVLIDSKQCSWSLLSPPLLGHSVVAPIRWYPPSTPLLLCRSVNLHVPATSGRHPVSCSFTLRIRLATSRLGGWREKLFPATLLGTSID